MSATKPQPTGEVEIAFEQVAKEQDYSASSVARLHETIGVLTSRLNSALMPEAPTAEAAAHAGDDSPKQTPVRFSTNLAERIGSIGRGFHSQAEKVTEAADNLQDLINRLQL